MRKLFSSIANAPFRLMAGVAVGTLVSGTASAQQSMGGMAVTVRSQLGEVGNLVVAGAFLAGLGLTGAGLFKLKAAADSQGQQVKYSEGLWRLGVGAGLVALPAITGVGVGTFGFTGGEQGPAQGSIVIQ